MSGEGSKGSKPDAVKDDAYEYIRAVKDTFHNNRDKYNEFLAIMGKFKARRIDRADCMERAKKLFRGHPDLISGFKYFLPESLKLNDWHREEVKRRR